ncbi:hypothetical protein [Agrococcus sp. KRD186]|jgi:hypothetical protein|uniref:hypothetical protein n=1 Tax=Agrococcus sp. KRD186 TaxID=2729730 RepID=UPI0019D0CEE0|nr:hypothetical protein [Agrococcus sp. KRD186]
MSSNEPASFDPLAPDGEDTAFGNLLSASGRALAPFSRASESAAENLMEKARAALVDGDRERAVALVDRAIALPFDQHEQQTPAAAGAGMQLFLLVTDELEAADADDARWLDAALDVLETADPSARCDLRDVLLVVDQDFFIEPAESRRIRAAVRTIPQRTELRDLAPDDPELADRIMSVLAACNAYDARLDTLQ